MALMANEQSANVTVQVEQTAKALADAPQQVEVRAIKRVERIESITRLVRPNYLRFAAQS
jgi:hypothetical protein